MLGAKIWLKRARVPPVPEARSPGGLLRARCESIQPQDIGLTNEANLWGEEGGRVRGEEGDSQTCPQPPLLAADTLPSLSVL